MDPADRLPCYIMVEFLHPDGEAVRLADMGSAFMKAQQIPPGNGPQPFRVAVEKKRSRAGNAFYDYVQNGVPLPDGLSTAVKVAGIVIPMGEAHPSQRGHPTREGSAPVVVEAMPYTATVYLTQSRSPFYVKVIAHKTPSSAAGIPTRLPRGGRIVT